MGKDTNPTKQSSPVRRALARPDVRLLLTALILLGALTALTWNVAEPGGTGGALSEADLQATRVMTQFPSTTQTISAEVLANRNSTTGIILFSLMLVLIVLGGAFFTTRKKSI